MISQWIVALVLIVGGFLPNTLEQVHGPQLIVRKSIFDPPALIENKLIFPTGPGQTCIAVQGPTAESSIVSSVILKNITCAPGNGYSWLTCVDLTNGWLSHLDTINCIGPSGLPTPVTTNGFILRGQSTDVSMNHIRCSGAWTCVYITDESEGPRITDLSVVGAVYGVVVTTPGIEPGFTLAHAHLNVTHVGVWLKNRREWVMDDVLIYAGNYFKSTEAWPFYAVSLDHSPVGEFRSVRVSNVDKKTPFSSRISTESDRVRGDVEVVVW